MILKEYTETREEVTYEIERFIDNGDINIFAPLLNPSLRLDFDRSWSHNCVNDAVERLENTHDKHYKTNELNIYDSIIFNKNDEPLSMWKDGMKLNRRENYRSI